MSSQNINNKIDYPNLIKLILALFVAGSGLALVTFFNQYSLFVRLIFLLISFIVSIFIYSFTPNGAKVIKLIKDSRIEILKVVWPNKDTLLRSSMMVIVVVILFSILIWLIDLLIKYIINIFIG